MFHVATTRFNTETFEENSKWRTNHSHPGCIYGVMKPITMTAISLESYLFVLEMNNELNEIMGVGFIQNMVQPRENVAIHANRNYCYFAYHSPYRVDRCELDERSCVVLEILEILVFKGATHMKRGQGITVVPERLLLRGKLDFQTELMGLFKRKYKELRFNDTSVELKQPETHKEMAVSLTAPHVQ